MGERHGCQEAQTIFREKSQGTCERSQREIMQAMEPCVERKRQTDGCLANIGCSSGFVGCEGARKALRA